MSRPLDVPIPCRPSPSRPAPSYCRTALAVGEELPWRAPNGELAPARSRSRSTKRARNGRRKPSAGKRLLRALGLMAAVGVAGALAVFPNVRAAASAALSSPETAFGQSHVRLLLLGADRDYGARGERLEKSGRSDTLMVADLDLQRNTVHLCSIPRDTEADVPGHGVLRINSAYAMGGPALAAQTVSRLLNAPISHTVALDLDAFQEAVDAVGGVDVNVPKALDYDDHWGNLAIHIPAGEQHLDGARAMQFVRFRHDAMGDIGRATRQQAFMHALAAALRRPSSLSAWPAVLRAVQRHTQTDLSPAQMVALGRFARALPPGAITAQTLPGRFDGPRWRPNPIRPTDTQATE